MSEADNAVTETENSESKLTEVEQRAYEDGWRPKETWVENGGDPAQWRNAELFLALDPFYKKIEGLSRDNKGLRAGLQEMKGLFSKVKEAEYKRALEDLKLEKRAALHAGDVDGVMDADEKIDRVKSDLAANAALPTTPVVPEIHPEVQKWKERNKWYESDEDLTAWAEGKIPQLVKRGLSPEQVLTQLEKDVKEKFPSKFRNTNRDRASSVDSPTTSARGRGDSFELSADEQRIMNTIVRTGVMTKEQYIAEFKKIQNR